MVGISGDAAAIILHPGFIKGWDKTAGCDMGNNKTPPKGGNHDEAQNRRNDGGTCCNRGVGK